MKAIGEVPVRKTCNKVLGLVKSREGSSPYGRGLSILANEGVCLRPQHGSTLAAASSITVGGELYGSSGRDRYIENHLKC